LIDQQGTSKPKNHSLKYVPMVLFMFGHQWPQRGCVFSLQV